MSFPEGRVPYILASSVTARLGDTDRYSLSKTVQIAAGRADGTQLFVNPSSFQSGKEDTGRLRDALEQAGLSVNVVHLPGHLVPIEFEREAAEALGYASDILTPIPDVGKVCVIHHDPFSPVTDDAIIESARRVVARVDDPLITLGLEHFHPPALTNQDNLSAQVDRYLELLRRLSSYVPTVPVIDIGRFYSTSNAHMPPRRLDDPEFKLLERICQAVRGRNVLIHAADQRDINLGFREPGNLVPIGEGQWTPVLRKLAVLGRQYQLRWIGVVDETEDSRAISDRAVVQGIFASI